MKLRLYPMQTVAVLLLAAVTSCSTQDQDKDDWVVYMMPQAKTMQLTAPQKSLVENNNDFSFHLFRTVNQINGTKKSCILSPISVTYMLGMINDAATDQTQEEITNTLGLSGKTAREINELCQTLMTQAPELDGQVTLKTANAIYTNRGYTLKSDFSKDMAAYYKANAKTLDFSLPDAAKEMNGWTNKQTNGMIPEIVDTLNPHAVTYLLNAVYFQAKWTKQFDAKKTQREDFTNANGAKVKVEMMHNKAEALYAYNDTYSTLWLPYGSDTAWNMMVLLPREGKTVDDVMATLTTANWKETLNNAQRTELDINMPKFTTNNTTELNELLKAMGIQRAFNRNYAQIPNMCEKVNLFISKMLQKARIEVDEEGSKATAVNVTGTMETTALPMMLEKGEFHADRPFVYLISENNSNAIFFVGTYMGD